MPPLTVPIVGYWCFWCEVSMGKVTVAFVANDPNLTHKSKLCSRVHIINRGLDSAGSKFSCPLALLLFLPKKWPKKVNDSCVGQGVLRGKRAYECPFLKRLWPIFPEDFG